MEKPNNKEERKVRKEDIYIKGKISCFSEFWFTYLNKLMDLHKVKDLKLENLFMVNPKRSFKQISEDFINLFNKRKAKKKVSFYWAFIDFVKNTFF